MATDYMIIQIKKNHLAYKKVNAVDVESMEAPERS